jgi:putative MATE family efflux protein
MDIPAKETTQGNPLGTAPIKSMIWKFAIPGIISSLVNAAHNIVDQIFIGWGGIGELGIAATNIAFPLATITTALATLFGMGGASRFSLFMGEGKPDEGRKALGNGLFLMVSCGLAIGIGGVVFLKPMLYAFGTTDTIMPYAEAYTLIISMGIPFGIFAAGASFFIRADGSPKYSSAILLSAAVFNIIFDPIFLFVFGMGIKGIALATTLGQMLSTILALYYLTRKFKFVSLEKKDFALKRKTVKGIISLGSAAFSQHMANTIVQIVLLNILKSYGARSAYGSEIPLAAAGAVNKIMLVFLAAVIGIALGCQPIYGFNYGSKKYGRVKEAYLRAVSYATVIVIVAFFCIQIFPRQILGILGSTDPAFYDFAVRYMRIYLFMTFANALQPVTSTFFTAIGKAYVGLCMALIRQMFLLIPLLLILPALFGIEGLFFAGAVSDGIAAVIVVFVALRQMSVLTKLHAGLNTNEYDKKSNN